MKTLMTLFVTSLMLSGCGQSSPDSTPERPQTDPAIYAAALANPTRTDADRQRDAGRKPAAVLEFLGIQPGMTVLDMFSGGGYYSEVLAHVVGGDGRVIAHTNSAYAQFVGAEFEARYANNRLPNVDILMAENNELELASDSVDAIMMVLSFHDLYYVAPDSGWPKIDGPALLAELYDGLRPGGVLGIIDHVAETGSPRETGGTLHRIDPGIVIGELEAAGFVLEAKSDLLRSKTDDYSKNVFDESVRGNTDRMLLRFRKPD